MRGATLVLGLLLVGACGSRTDLWSLGGSGGSAPAGGGGNAGALGTGGIGVGGSAATGTGATGGSGGGGTGGAGTGGTTTGTGGTGTGGTTTGTGGTATGGTTTGTGGTGTGGTTTGTGGGPGTGGATTGTGGTGGIGTGGAGKGGAGAGGTGGAGGKGGAPPDAGTTCLEPIRGAFAAMDLYFLIDKSASMATVDPPNVMTDTRWERTTAAVNRFALQTGQPFRLGIGFFPLPSASDSGVASSCASADYATPSVPMHLLLPGDSRVGIALAAQTPGGESPTGPAFDGALGYTLRWAASPPPPDELPSRSPPAIVLMTDGAPTACGSTVDGLVAAAAAAFRGTPRIRTYVLAIGPEATGLDSIAAAGGSHRAFVGGPRDFEEAFDKIARTRIVCDIPLTDAILGSPDLQRIEIRSRLVRSMPFTANRRVQNAESCGTEGGWFFEPPARPTMILFCPSTCAALIDAPAGEVQAGVPCSNAPASSTPPH